MISPMIVLVRLRSRPNVSSSKRITCGLNSEISRSISSITLCGVLNLALNPELCPQNVQRNGHPRCVRIGI